MNFSTIYRAFVALVSGNLVIAAQETGTVADESANDFPSADDEVSQISGYEEEIISRLAVYEKLLSKTDPENQETKDQYIKDIARTKRDWEYYR